MDAPQATQASLVAMLLCRPNWIALDLAGAALFAPFAKGAWWDSQRERWS
jgi:hypothetical protein